jgi:aryl-alcohol dehydrogenase-like predicted oxidoreductase
MFEGVPTSADEAFPALRRRGLSPLGLGCARIGSLSSGVTAEQARATFAAAAAHGVTLFDTAGIYGGGDSERLVGEHARAHPGTYIMTKIGRRHGLSGRLAHWAKRWARPLLDRRTQRLAAAARQRGVPCDFSSRSLEAATRAALRRLGRKSVHALLLHSPPARALADPAVAITLAAFKRRGDAEQVGVSCDQIEALRLAAAFDMLDIIQLPIGLYRTARLDGLIDRLIERKVAIVVRGVLRERAGVAARDALAAAAALPGVASVIIGVSSPAHLNDIVARDHAYGMTGAR